jgi:hypothetical protein
MTKEEWLTLKVGDKVEVIGMGKVYILDDKITFGSPMGEGIPHFKSSTMKFVTLYNWEVIKLVDKVVVDEPLAKDVPTISYNRLTYLNK